MALTLRILYHCFGTTPKSDPEVEAAVAAAIVYIDTVPDSMRKSPPEGLSQEPKDAKRMSTPSPDKELSEEESENELTEEKIFQARYRRKKKLNDEDYTQAVYLRTGITIHDDGSGEKMTRRQRKERARSADSLVAIYPEMYGPREEEIVLPHEPLTSTEVDKYRRDLYTFADQCLPNITLQQLMSASLGWQIVSAGLGMSEGDPHFSQKHPVWDEWLRHQRSRCCDNGGL